MIVSLNEIETTVLKAARGAGMEWGLAEEAAQAVRWLAGQSLPFAQPLGQLLQSGAWRNRPILDVGRLRPQDPDEWLCPIRVGACLSDLDEAGPMLIEHVFSPILLLPFAVRRDAGLQLAWDDVTVRLAGGGVAIVPAHATALAAIHADQVAWNALTGGFADALPQSTQTGGIRVDPTLWAKLQSFEARTYVPASARSRLTGAGALRSDND